MGPSISKLVSRIAKKLDNQKVGGQFFDVVAIIGLYFCEVRKICPLRNILDFEPDPENFKLLEITQKETNLQNLKISNTALSNQVGDVLFFTGQINFRYWMCCRKRRAMDQIIPK